MSNNKMKDLYPLILESFEHDMTFTFPVHGTSMRPMLYDNDLVTIKKIDSSLNKGDIVLFKRDSGEFVLHRIRSINKDCTFNIVGDHQTMLEKNVRLDQMIGKVIEYKLIKKNKTYNLKSFKYKLYKLLIKSKCFRYIFAKIF